VAEIMDNDPLVLVRREQEKAAVESRLEQAKLRATSLENRITQLDLTRRNELSANESRIRMATETARAAEQQIKAGEADLISQRQNLDRSKALLDKGFISVRQLEVAEQNHQTAIANVDRFKAQLAAAYSDKMAREADQSRIETQYQTQIQDANASLAAARADVQNIMAELKRMEITLARQATQNVTAPRPGTILRLLAQPGSELLKSGDPIAQFVPESGSLSVALWMYGNDTPLIHKGDKVRLQFEGWPAVQFAGWPSVAVGTFGGRVFLVDPTDDGNGKFRILVEPDPEDKGWPEARYLRQGIRTNGWVLLRQVPLGFELWRRFNGFPPAISNPEAEMAKGAAKEEKK
jgi:multidrug resistance efflux pump